MSSVQGGLHTHGAALVARGYQPIPIPPGLKFPKGLTDWQTIEADQDDVAGWLANGYKDAGVGVLTKHTPAVDLDIRDAEMVDVMRDYIRETFGYPPERIGNAPKSLFVFRTSAPFTKMSSRKFTDMFGRVNQIEVLGDGQQFVAFAVHPDTKQPYYWPGESLADVPYNDLPVLTADKAAALIDYFEASVPDYWEVDGERQTGSLSSTSPLSAIERAKPTMRLTDEEVSRCLELIVDRVDNRDYWITVGMALHHQYDGHATGLGLWEAWSSESDKFKEGECAAKWAGFGKGGHKPITFATIFKWAKAAHLKQAAKAVKQHPLMTLEELESKLGPINWLIEDTIEADSLSLMFGAPGSYKSFLAIDWACCVASGTPWQGRAVEQGSVIYVAGEGHNGLARRITAWQQENVSLKGAPIAFTRTSVSILDPDSIERITLAIAEAAEQIGDPALIIIDTLARNFGPGDENSTSDMSQFIDAVSVHFRERFGANVLLVHHTGKGNQSAARGASALHAAMDCEYRLEAHDGMPGILRLTNTKMKDAAEPKDVFLRPREVRLGSTMDDSGEMTSVVLDGQSAPVREIEGAATEVEPESEPERGFERPKLSAQQVNLLSLFEEPTVFRDGLQTRAIEKMYVPHADSFRTALSRLAAMSAVEVSTDASGRDTVTSFVDREYVLTRQAEARGTMGAET